VSGLACPSCGEAAIAEDRWCEACGAALVAGGPPPPDTATATASPAPPTTPRTPPERREVVDGPVAAVSDRGTSHWRNEDAVGLRWLGGEPSGFVLVVSDGVSMSQDPHVVSQAAVDAAVGVLAGAVVAGRDLGAAMADGAAAAQRAAAGVPYDPGLELGPGACTLVAAAVRGREAAFASIGDSRAYWVDAEGAIQISRDDSLAAELVASGAYTAQQAMTTAGAHALTKWLGVDSTDAEPTVTCVELTVPGLVVLASDGLWNYAPEPADLARLVGPPGAESALAVARRLAAFAEAAGGADNITVAVGPYGFDRRGVT
jgi:PPM family protein phosphatase